MNVLHQGSTPRRSLDPSAATSPTVENDVPRRLLVAVDHPEPALTNALSAALGGSAKWRVRAACGAIETIELLDNGALDAVVIDARVGPDGGLGLLREARNRQPQAQRYLLSGSGDQDTILRALSVAHRVLPRPCRPDALAEMIARTHSLRSLLGCERVRTLVAGVTQLPPAPTVYLRMTEVLNDCNAGSADVAEIVSEDPALAATVLRLCNSAFFSTGRTIVDVRSAVMRLGFRTLRHLVLAGQVFGRPLHGSTIDVDALQRRSLIASVLAPLVHDHWAEADLARTAALLADIGLLLPGLPATDGRRPAHSEAGAHLLALWGMPESVVEAAAFCHDPISAGERRFGLVGAVHVAVSLASGGMPDDEYLRRVGLHLKLQEWIKLKNELVAMA